VSCNLSRRGFIIWNDTSASVRASGTLQYARMRIVQGLGQRRTHVALCKVTRAYRDRVYSAIRDSRRFCSGVNYSPFLTKINSYESCAIAYLIDLILGFIISLASLKTFHKHFRTSRRVWTVTWNLQTFLPFTISHNYSLNNRQFANENDVLFKIKRNQIFIH